LQVQNGKFEWLKDLPVFWVQNEIWFQLFVPLVEEIKFDRKYFENIFV
jgi:hypothetical protein